MITASENQKFCGREFTPEELSLIQEVSQACTGLSRTELSHTVCELLDWRRAGGGLKARQKVAARAADNKRCFLFMGFLPPL